MLFSLFYPDELVRNIGDLLKDYNNLFYVSTVSIQETIHLYKKGKIKTTWKRADDILPSIELNFEILPVKKEHLITYSKLSTPESHNDPNDHVIISQAITEKMALISSDHQFEDFKSCTKDVKNYRNMLNAKNRQSEHLKKETGKVTDTVIFYFHDAGMYSYDKVKKGIDALDVELDKYKRRRHIKRVICVVGDGRVEEWKE